MMNKETVLARVRGLFGGQQAPFDKRMIHPVRDWFIGVVFFIAMIAAGGAYSAFLFVEYRNIAADENVSEDPTVRYNDVLVENMLKLYKTRSASYEALTKRIPVSAPSVEHTQSEVQTSSSTIESSTQEAVGVREEEDNSEGTIEEAVIAN